MKADFRCIIICQTGKSFSNSSMKKKSLFTGSVFQFYVPEIKKYAFCKFFDFRHLSGFHGLLAQVFDKFSDKEENKIEDLKGCDWLFGPRSMHKWPNLRKDTGWKSLGILLAAEDDVPQILKMRKHSGLLQKMNPR